MLHVTALPSAPHERDERMLAYRFGAPDFGPGACLTFGRLRPIHTNATFYGWASLAWSDSPTMSLRAGAARAYTSQSWLGSDWRCSTSRQWPARSPWMWATTTATWHTVGGVYSLLPSATHKEPSQAGLTLHFRMAVVGSFIYVISLSVGGSLMLLSHVMFAWNVWRMTYSRLSAIEQRHRAQSDSIENERPGIGIDDEPDARTTAAAACSAPPP